MTIRSWFAGGELAQTSSRGERHPSGRPSRRPRLDGRRRRHLARRAARSRAALIESLEPRLALSATVASEPVDPDVRAAAATVPGGPAPVVRTIQLPPAATYGVGKSLTYGLQFSVPVVVVGAPTLSVRIGETMRELVYRGGSGTRRLVFSLTVQPGELDTNGVEVVGPLTLPAGASIRDGRGNDARVTLPAVPPKQWRAVRVDGVAPTLAVVQAPVAAGRVVNVTARFDEPIVVSGRPTLPLIVNGWERMATLTTTRNNAMTFTYRLAPRESAASVRPAGPPILPFQHAIRDRAGNIAAMSRDRTENQLITSVQRIAAGSTIPVVFELALPAAVPADRVRLFKADASGSPTSDYLVDLFDDGSFVHRDARASDRRFANVVSLNLPTAGTVKYAAVVTSGGGERAYPVTLEVVAPPSAATAAARATRFNAIGSDFAQAVNGGGPASQAFTSARAAVAAAPDVNPASIVITGSGIYWQTVDGIGSGIINVPSRSRAQAAAVPQFGSASMPNRSAAVGGSVAMAAMSSAVVSATTAAEGCGRALVIDALAREVQTEFSGYPYYGITYDSDYAGVVETLRSRGYTVDEKYGRQVTVDAMANWSSYDVVIVNAIGGQISGTDTSVTLTAEIVDPGQDRYRAEMTAGLVQTVSAAGNTYYAVTEEFFALRAGQLTDSVIYFSTDDSRKGDELAAKFLDNLGASVFMGYTAQVPNRPWASQRGQQALGHLLDKNPVSGIPGVNQRWRASNRTPLSEAMFSTLYRDGNKTLDPQCDLLKDYDIVLSYTWPVTQRDLDTSTRFLGTSVGYRAPNTSPYMLWSGDDTSAGGQETVVVDVYAAHQQGRWSSSEYILAYAGWFTPAGGSGPATLTAFMRHKTTGVQRGAVQLSIGPGSQSGEAEAIVGLVAVSASGSAGREKLAFDLNQNY